jgi:hypothetical protein
VNNLALLVAAIMGSMQDVARQSGFLFNLTSPPEGAIGETAALNQTVQYADVPIITGGTVTPGPTPPNPDGITATGPSFKLTEHKYRAFKLTPEESLALGRLGPQFRSVAINAAIAGLMEDASTYLANLMATGCGLVHGAPTTDPFASNPNILVDAWRTMADDKAPEVDRLAALSTVHYGAASKLTQFQKLSEAPEGVRFATSRLGMLANWNTGYDQASGVLQTTVAAGGYAVNNGPGYAAGTKTIAIDTGTGGFAAGDVVTVAGNFEKGTSDLAKMVVASATADSLTFTRGLITAVANDAAIVRIATHRKSILAHKAATVFALRPSADMPEGDLATQRRVVIDSLTGFGLRLAYYPGWFQGSWVVSIVYGGVVRRPEWVRGIIS